MAKKIPLSAAAGKSIQDEFVNGAPDMQKLNSEKKKEKTTIRLNFDVDLEDMKLIRIAAAEQNRNIKDIMIDLIHKEFRK